MTNAKIFSRGGAALPRAVSGDGAWITDATGRRYLDAAGGAIVVGVGHGRANIAVAAADAVSRSNCLTHPAKFWLRRLTISALDPVM